MERHKIDKLFADKLKTLEQKPSTNTWQEIAQSLDKNSNNNRWRRLGIAVSIVLFCTIGIILLPYSTPKPLNYHYAADNEDNNIVPKEVIIIPVIIGLQPASSPQIATSADITDKPATGVEDNLPPITVTTNSAASLIADSRIPEQQLKPVIQEPLPIQVISPHDNATASTQNISTTNKQSETQPVTIIYKPGPLEEKSKLSKALTYMEQVRTGEKKILNLEKFRNNIQTKFKKNKLVNSK